LTNILTIILLSSFLLFFSNIFHLYKNLKSFKRSHLVYIYRS